jgi:hypothetical protein
MEARSISRSSTMRDLLLVGALGIAMILQIEPSDGINVTLNSLWHGQYVTTHLLSKISGRRMTLFLLIILK